MAPNRLSAKFPLFFEPIPADASRQLYVLASKYIKVDAFEDVDSLDEQYTPNSVLSSLLSLQNNKLRNITKSCILSIILMLLIIYTMERLWGVS